MFGIDTLVFLLGPFVVPFLVGLKAKSKKRGLVPLLVIPALSLVSGLAMFTGSGTYRHTDATPQDFAAVWLIGMGIYFGFVFTTCWLIGRWVRNRQRPESNPTKLISTPEPPHAVEITGEGGTLRLDQDDLDTLQSSSPFEERFVYASSSAMGSALTELVRIGATRLPVHSR